MRSLTWDEVRARQVARSHLVERAPAEHLVDVVRDVCGVHAQVAAAAELALAARVGGIAKQDVREALWERRTLVKTPSLRTTLHVHAADDLAVWTAARRINPYWLDEAWLAPFGLTPDHSAAILDAIADALDGRCLTRAELGDEIARRLGSWVLDETDVITWGGRRESRWPRLITPAAYTGRLCFGPNRGNRVTFVRTDQWIRDWRSLDAREAFIEALRRYLAAYGPARAVDFGHWFGVHRQTAEQGLDALRSEVEEVEVAGMAAWQLAARAKEQPQKQRSVRLVPEFDCYVIGAAALGEARRDLVPEAAGNRVFDRGGGPFPTLLVDGRAAGVWERRRRGRRLDIRVEPFRRLTAAQRRELEAERAHMGEFLGLEVSLSIG